MEMYRSLILHKKANQNHATQKKGAILFTPDYRGNTYQGHLYSLAGEFGHNITACNELPNNETVASLMASHKNIIIHQHWLKEIYKNSKTDFEAINAVHIHIGKLKALKALGAKIIWTLHNLLDHDLDKHQKDACLVALKEMSLVSDKILIHSKNSEAALNDITETRISKEKFQILEHPLYDDLETIDSTLPPELPSDIKKTSNKIFASIGMIRPYKGIAELAEAISNSLEDIKQTNTHFIVAGRMMDPVAHEKLRDIKKSNPNALTVIPRVMSDNELSGLLKITDLMITPYRAILTSGSYYAATTFAKPVLAPQRGFFPEIITHGKNGYLYDGSTQELEEQLRELMKMEPDVFANTGYAAKAENSKNTTKQFSTSYFQHIENWTS